MQRWLFVVCCACLACAAWAQQSPYKMQGSADLNGDGKAEVVAITWKDGQKTFTLQIGAVRQVVPIGSDYGYVKGFHRPGGLAAVCRRDRGELPRSELGRVTRDVSR